MTDLLLYERYLAVQNRLRLAAHRAGRQAEEITLVAVSKTWPGETLIAAYEAGMRHFGENRVEELAMKRPSLEAQFGPKSGVTWHAIGTLQSRKTELAATHADVFHALDRLKIANRLSRDLVANGRFGKNGRTLPIFLEVNLSGETSKSGFACTNWEEDERQTAVLRSAGQQVTQLPHLSLAGLMTMAPWGVETAVIRQVFRRTRQLAEWLQTSLDVPTPLQLSMGMTDDFEIAIEEGATHVRVGRAIFGERNSA
jgi:pyridoxal phosphate enzyme (YggS family)